MKKLFIFLFITTIFSNSSFAMTEEEYWKSRTERLIESRRVCAEEAHKSGSFNSEIFRSCNAAADEVEEIIYETFKKGKAQKCASVRARIESTKGQSAGSDSANFLMGMLNAYMEDEACY